MTQMYVLCAVITCVFVLLLINVIFLIIEVANQIICSVTHTCQMCITKQKLCHLMCVVKIYVYGVYMGPMHNV